MQNLQCSSGKYDGISIQDLAYNYSEGEVIEERVHPNHTQPWNVVPELDKMDKRISYSDVMKGMTSLMRSTMVFYNFFVPQNESSLTAVVGMPYTPKMLNQMSPQQMYALVKNLNMKIK